MSPYYGSERDYPPPGSVTCHRCGLPANPAAIWGTNFRLCDDCFAAVYIDDEEDW